VVVAETVEPIDDQILTAISSLASKGYQPTYRDVATDVGLSVSAVHRHVRALRERGLVHAEDAIARSLSVTPDGHALLREHSRASS
jgi:DNA-binding MarR family transcriptional regulator